MEAENEKRKYEAGSSLVLASAMLVASPIMRQEERGNSSGRGTGGVHKKRPSGWSWIPCSTSWPEHTSCQKYGLRLAQDDTNAHGVPAAILNETKQHEEINMVCWNLGATNRTSSGLTEKASQI